jgi:hypothetical protein
MSPSFWAGMPFLGMPVLRRVNETKKGPHRSATPESVQMKLNIIPTQEQAASVRSTVELVTPSVARHLRDTAHFARQRNISQSNIDRLSAEMSLGRFTAGTQIYICVLPNGQQLIVNGNHTLEAIHACGVPQVLTVTRKKVADEDEAGRVYAVFDIQKVRSWRDSLRATGIGDDIPNANYVMSAVGVIDARFGETPPSQMVATNSRLTRIERLEEYRMAADMWAEATAGAPTNSMKLVRRAAVMAVALETFRYQPSLASEFWGRCAHDNGLVLGMPEKALLNWLRNTRSSGGSSIREHCRAAALAWNASFRGEDRHFVKPNKMTSFFLLGTPISGGLRG